MKLSNTTKQTILSIKFKISQDIENSYISDRRWKQATYLVKASAYFCDRKETNTSDLFVLSYCLWSEIGDKKEIEKIIQEEISENPFTSESRSKYIELIEEKEKLSKEIDSSLQYENDIYKTVKFNGKEYFEIDLKEITEKEYDYKDSHLYINADHINESQSYHISIKENDSIVFKKQLKIEGIISRDSWNHRTYYDNVLAKITYDFEGSSNCRIKIEDIDYNKKKEYNYIPEIKYKKGSQKESKYVSPRILESFKIDINELKIDLKELEKTIQDERKLLEVELISPFIEQTLTEIPLKSIDEYLKNLQVEIKDCDRLLEIIDL